MTQKTWLPSQKEIEASRKWHSVDASSKPLGRLATQIAVYLMGKHKKIYTPSFDCGDFVVVTNASKIKLTGAKAEQKFYFRHSGYAGGAKVIPFQRQMSKDPTKVIHLAVKRMLGVNRLRAKRLKRLKVFAGEQSQFLQTKKTESKKEVK
ncbi:MAG TPA: 50S ribosomal protein L13 [Elusimicrobiales bacterium]|nr:50S ribosomal protein L13 [Elusimicrobiales bacterium]